ncbi:alpha/beta hydrolase [Loktanella sp. TSTF-M6]|uniref:Alpha/beta hydrolase n=1 Tax=Loktanella gaetbuli TaxID=2881335 RepID=A0ABS8BTK6_9RHOB|nr:alpha/beta hydrolase [Loktanella gaetbuli]MCB5199063.1 alpha/beta hydrolase [Loktanella gaetbuli]
MINPEIDIFLKVWNEKWSTLPKGSGPAERRTHFEDIAEDMRLPTPDDVDCSKEHIVDTSAGPVRVRVFRYQNDDLQPCLIYMHGGAWMQGSPETHWDITARIASWNRQTVISVDYALAPERPFPQAYDQCLAVTKWVKAESKDLSVDPDRISIGGDSAGANLAAAVSLALQGTDDMPMAQLLVYPACDFDTSRPSMVENADGPLIFVKDMDAVNAMYCPNAADLKDPRAAPLYGADHTGLPPAFIAVAQYDPLRDSGRAYAETLKAAGVDVVLDQGEGLIHGYLRAMEFCSDSVTKLEDMAAWLRDMNDGKIG